MLQILITISLLLLSACGAATPPPPDPNSPGALAYDREAARQDLAVAQTRDAVSARLEKAATANAQATDRAIVQRATATEQAWLQSQRAHAATVTAAAQSFAATATTQAFNMQATANALALAATVEAQRSQATAQAVAVQATADARAIEAARMAERATADARNAALAAQQAEASTQIAIERERNLSMMVTSLCSITVIGLIIAFTVAMIVIAQAANARWGNLTMRRLQGGMLVIVGNNSVGYTTRFLRLSPPNGQMVSSGSPCNEPEDGLMTDTPPIEVLSENQVTTPHIRPRSHSTELRLVSKLLRESSRANGGESDKIATWEQLGWYSEDWQRAKWLIRDYVIVRKGRGGGTYIVHDELDTLHKLLTAVLSNEIPLPSLADRPGETASAHQHTPNARQAYQPSA